MYYFGVLIDPANSSVQTSAVQDLIFQIFFGVIQFITRAKDRPFSARTLPIRQCRGVALTT